LRLVADLGEEDGDEDGGEGFDHDGEVYVAGIAGGASTRPSSHDGLLRGLPLPAIGAEDFVDGCERDL
jgi:hypothetical protein